MEYIKENEAEFELCNIVEWHKQGYTGKGIKIANMEKANPNLYFFEGKVKDPFNIGRDDYSNKHANKTTDVLHQVAPDADIYILSNSGSYMNDKVKSGDIVEKSLPFIEQENIHLVNASLGGNDVEELNNIILSIQNKGSIFVTSAGNKGERGLTGYAKSNIWISVAALGYSENKDKIFLKDYSSRGEELDISCFSGLYIHDARKGYENRVFQVEGTSFSSPMLCGMLALVQQFFLEKAGRTLYQDEMIEFIKDHVVDLGEIGCDEMYGYGLFVLPNPNEINISKYLLRSDSMVFKDINGHWAEESIKNMVLEGIIKGYEDGTFRPDEPITRAEMAVIAERILRKVK